MPPRKKDPPGRGATNSSGSKRTDSRDAKRGRERRTRDDKREAARRSRDAKREAGRRTAIAIRDAITAALSQDRDLTPEGGAPLEGGRTGDSPLAVAAGGIESALADAVRRRPSFLGRLAYGTAQLVSTLASEDRTTGRRFAELAEGSHVGIVFIDVVGFTAYTATNGDDAAVELVGKLEGIVATVCRHSQGELVKHLGDGFLLAFASASQAIRAALALRDDARRAHATDSSFQRVRIAVHAGRPSVVRDDLIGHDVNLTARLLEHCDPGEVLVTKEAKDLVEDDLQSVRFSDAGDVKARGVPQPVATYRADAG